MAAVNMGVARSAKRLTVAQAANGREFMIAKASKPMVHVMLLEAQPTVRAPGSSLGHRDTKVDPKNGTCQRHG